MSNAVQSKHVQVNGIGIHYREWGDADAPDLLLVHGWTTNGLVWIDIAEALQDSFHIIVPDNRGNGESEKPKTGYRLRDYADDLHQLIHTLGLRRPFFVGHSWGGNIGTYMAAEYPQDISKAVLEDPVYWKMVNAFVTLLPGFLAMRNRPEAEIRAEAQRRGLTPEETQREVYRHHHFSRDAITHVTTENRDWALACEESIRRIAVPTLILVGDNSVGGYMLPEELEYYRRIASPNVQFRLWEGVGHMMHGPHPQRFAQEVAAFLSEQ